ncbi:biopolymer transport protein ExbB [Selenomonas sp. WCT3]|uniref:MotA/TolQ/ExbB proton channel family protein n=1 Tax=unclassified Selenomonas TaxID=2637378 RepID=UPI0008869B1A|nr:MotA/TolQ/ExbB proton channel family protein [Selenomonas sp.]MCR5438039.1 MotA/TolQ/ExbB proton channel family protein [Selenomonas sp.]SDG64465.1 biopolymer transport protein ExbB [Selenomonas ruminantium]
MEIFTLFHKGGMVMYPILLASVIALTIGLERFAYYRKERLKLADFSVKFNGYLQKGKQEQAENLCRKAGAPGEVLLTALAEEQYGNREEVVMAAAKRKAIELRQYLEYLSVIVTMAPLLGLLGTVTGMIQSFSVLNVADGEPFAITGGVGEALIATATGLLVAILALCLYSYLSHRANAIIADVEYVSIMYVAAGGKDDAN